MIALEAPAPPLPPLLGCPGVLPEPPIVDAPPPPPVVLGLDPLGPSPPPPGKP